MTTNPTEADSPEGAAGQDEIIQGHSYDGIREYDNPMPGWWVWIFWACVLFSIVYVLGVHTFGFIDTYGEDLAEAQAELQTVRDAYASVAGTATVDEETLATYVIDEVHVAAGAATYATYCVPCHGQNAEGLIGPNLTDAYWIHDPSLVTMFNIVTNGVLEKGMTPWGNILSIEQRAQVVAFVRTLVGTNPEGAKPPQGELVEVSG